MMNLDSKSKGYLFLVLALVLFYIGSYFKEPLLAHHKLLVAGSHEDGGYFEKSVILMLTHTPGGGVGLIVNRDGTGGPVDPDGIYILHTPDVMLQDSVVMNDLGLAYASGPEAAEELRASMNKPDWYAVLKGYSGWGPKQLDREIRRGVWKVIDYDKALVVKTPAAKMHTEAARRPEAALTPQ